MNVSLIVVFDTPSSSIETIRSFVPKFNELLNSFEKRNLYIISQPFK